MKAEQRRISAAVYLGTRADGATDKDALRHVFRIRSAEYAWPVSCANRYAVQNVLQEGKAYALMLENGVITAAEERLTLVPPCFYPPVRGQPGRRTLKNVLLTALMPVGTTLYVYGGGWNWQDDAAANQAMHIGLPREWNAFFTRQNEAYHYKNTTYYPRGGWNRWYYAGADCSGYLGWVVYNVLHAESRTVAESRGYVVPSAHMAARMAEWGLGTLHREECGVQPSESFRPGNIFSLNGHVWLCVGRCADGSLVIVHSTPSPSRDGRGAGGGVQLSALDPAEREDCAADRLCRRYMERYYPAWSARYASVRKSYAQYAAQTGAGRFSWHIADPDGYAASPAEDILADLYGEKK